MGVHKMAKQRKDYEETTTIQASPQKVYDFVSDVSNLPKYLPTTKGAQPQSGERVRVQGKAGGHSYDADGYFRTNGANERLTWGADEDYYSGWLDISGQGDNSSEVTVHITFTGGPPAGRGDPPGEGQERGPSDSDVQEGLGKGARVHQKLRRRGTQQRQRGAERGDVGT